MSLSLLQGFKPACQVIKVHVFSSSWIPTYRSTVGQAVVRNGRQIGKGIIHFGRRARWGRAVHEPCWRGLCRFGVVVEIVEVGWWSWLLIWWWVGRVGVGGRAWGRVGRACCWWGIGYWWGHSSCWWVGGLQNTKSTINITIMHDEYYIDHYTLQRGFPCVLEDRQPTVFFAPCMPCTFGFKSCTLVRYERLDY